MTALGAGANVSALFFNAEQPLERYNMPATLKTQHTAYLTDGNMLHSDMGRVLCSITADSLGWHDTWCGLSDAEGIRSRYGERRYQQHRTTMHRNGRDGMLIELAKHGLGAPDLVANVNFFSKVLADAEGRLQFVPGHCSAGGHVDLRFEMNTLVVLSSAPHPLDPSPVYEPSDVSVRAMPAPPMADNDLWRMACAQNARALINTQRYVSG